MKALEKTLAIIALLVLISQTVRHAYMLWFEPRGSVLDKYDRPAKSQIDAAKSLDELVRLYEPVRKQADEAREEERKAGKDVSYYGQRNAEPFKSEFELREAIRDWEQKSQGIHALRFYWVVGMLLCVLGFLAYRKLNRWFGLALLITAFSEFIYWTSPTFFGGTREFDRLLRNKLTLSLLTLAILILVIWFNRIFQDQDRPAAKA